MKKLLLFMVTMLLFFGFGFAWTYSTYSINPTLTLSDSNWYWVPVYCFLSWCYLDTVTLATSTDCRSWALFDYNLNLKASWVAPWQIIYVNQPLDSNKKYFFAIWGWTYNSQASCNHRKFWINSSNYDLLSASSPSSVYWLLWFAFDLNYTTSPSVSVNSSVFNYYYDFRVFTFSWTPDFDIPVNVHFNWNVEVITDSDIYLTWDITYSFISSSVFSWVSSWVSSSYFTITSPLWVQNIDKNLTLTGDVNYDSWFPDFIFSSKTLGSTVYSNGFLFNYTGLNFNITDVDNVVESWWILEIYSNASIPVARTWQVIIQTGDRAVVQSWNVFGAFIQSTTKMIFWNIGSIFIALGSIFIIWLILKLFWVRLKSRKKTFYS